MDIKTLIGFFKWCTIINVALFAFTAIMFLLVPELVYRTQSWFFPLPRETFNLVLYCFLGMYKLMIIVFNIVPLIALVMVSRRAN